MRIIEVVDYSSAWEEQFDKEVNLISGSLGEELIHVYHIGSTAIPDIVSKPIIDILLAQIPYSKM